MRAMPTCLRGPRVCNRILRSMHVFLETDRLLLRRFTGEDVDALVELNSDHDVMGFVPEPVGTSHREIEND